MCMEQKGREAGLRAWFAAPPLFLTHPYPLRPMPGAQTGISQRTVDTLYKKVDLDADGSITRHEFHKASCCGGKHMHAVPAASCSCSASRGLEKRQHQCSHDTLSAFAWSYFALGSGQGRDARQPAVMCAQVIKRCHAVLTRELEWDSRMQNAVPDNYVVRGVRQHGWDWGF